MAMQQDNTPTKCPFLSSSEFSTNDVSETSADDDEESGDTTSIGDNV